MVLNSNKKLEHSQKKIYDNFSALQDYFTDNSIFKFKKNYRLEDENYYELDAEKSFSICFDNFVLSEINENIYEELDIFIYNILTDFPQLFPLIGTSKTNKNRNRNNHTYNNKQKKRFIRLMKRSDYKEASKVYLKKRYLQTISDSYNESVIKERSKIEKFFNNQDLAKINIKLQNSLYKDITSREIRQDIIALLNRNFKDRLSENSKKKLSKYIEDEISLRIQEPKEYIELYDIDIFNKQENKFKTYRFEVVHKQIIKLINENISAETIWDSIL